MTFTIKTLNRVTLSCIYVSDYNNTGLGSLYVYDIKGYNPILNDEPICHHDMYHLDTHYNGLHLQLASM
jgi:hypothetical protein